MIHRLLYLLPLAAALVQPISAQEQLPGDGESERQLTEYPEWLLRFSNLEPQEKDTYITEFQAAKVAYMQSQWVSCEMHLNTCEMIFKGNPSIWNLRCSAYIEQNRIEEAEKELQRAQQALPNDDVTIVNAANLYLGKKDYGNAINHINSILDKIPYAQETLRDTLTYRVLLCHLMLGQTAEAKELVKDKTPLTDTPLYYFSKAAFSITDGKREAAMSSIRSAERIFGSSGTNVPYQRALNISGLIEKYLSAPVE